MGHRAPEAGRNDRLISLRGGPGGAFRQVPCLHDAPSGVSARTTIARLRLALAAAIALFLLAMSPGAAMAQGDITDFKLERSFSSRRE